MKKHASVVNKTKEKTSDIFISTQCQAMSHRRIDMDFMCDMYR